MQKFSTPLHDAAIQLVAALACLLVFALPARSGVNIQEVHSEKGITAWLVEDYTVPIVTLRFAFEGGSSQDPAGKEGLANLMSGLFDEGAGDLESDAFQEKLDDVGAEMRFSSSRDAIYGGMRVLAEDRQVAFDLLRLAIGQPRFDQQPIDRIRSQIVTGIDAAERDPNAQARKQWMRAIYGEHPYARPDEGTRQSLAAIAPDDLRAFRKSQFGRSGLHVAVIGAVDAETLKADLDRLFGDLPEQQDLKPVQRVDPRLGQEIAVAYDLPQTSIQMAFPGIERSDPDFYAAMLMNEILGGGTFTSRLFAEVREKRGLAYSVDSILSNRRYSSSLGISTATRSDRASETIRIIRDVVRQMADDGPTAAELEAAKKYLIGAYAINNLNSSGAVASTMVELQLAGLGRDYISRRPALLGAVTVDDVTRVARRLLTAEPAVLLVGPDVKKADAQ
ncbi:M16 family metallopeptidase [Aquamicrobium defluvii]|uniref:Zinc protease n=1 Tax=Aquamicrobium defluvii TaxID=69279 RepID=A0A011VK95_9HYPH|nr:pitrilysin family protein [Aquamicrobium defluvii]EXL08850.1 zinc protease [Aquamicrobium defluvii]EZQ15056.1 zinc protease [Halopseudomonas bauzanensis]TDR35384.1 zinc protease [Aquamicrobium defluvii]